MNSKQEKYLLADEFLDQSPAATVYNLEDLIRQGRIVRSREELVFKEAPSRLFWPGGERAHW